MKLDSRRMIKKAVTVAALFCMTTQTTFAALLTLAPVPLSVSQVPPKIMLTISKDQQLYKKAYNDYTDLDGDGTLELTYKHTIEYFGYFDPYKCYEYVTASNRFEPRSNTVIEVSAGPPRVVRPGLCSGARWSGNFLNWASMSRMDAVRKLLYGGLRQTDETFDAALRPVPLTILERAFLPTDAHAWAKYYNSDGTDLTNQPALNTLTPFSPPSTPSATNHISFPGFTIPAATGDTNITFFGGMPVVNVGDQVELRRTADPSKKFKAAVRDIAGTTVTLRVNAAGVAAGAAGTLAFDWTVVNLSSTGLSICNMTPGVTDTTNAASRSSTTTFAPRIRVATGNFGLWSANEGWQCQWSQERTNLQGGFPGGLRSNGNQTAISEIDASAESPSKTFHGLGTGVDQGDYLVRVKVCDPTLFDPLINAERCKRYPNGNLKPTGLLQEYGDNGRFHFGLMTGSHAKNVSGGVLRKNPGPLSDEVRVNSDGAFREANTDGTFRDHPFRPRGGPRNATSEQSPPGIINTLNYMRIYGYLYDNGTYIGSPRGDDCTYQLVSINENQCTSWGNPMSEIFFEAVRYFAGNTASAAYTYTAANSKDNELGLPLASFVAPLTTSNYCANLNVIVFNASVSDNDDDLRNTSGAAINASGTIAGLTDIVGNSQNENINGNNYFVGKVIGSTAAGDPGFELCSAKSITGMGNISGICPEGPTTAGSYLIAGIAHHAKANRIRPSGDPVAAAVPANDPNSLRVSTYGIQLASNTPQLEVLGTGTQRVVIQPIYRLSLPGGGVGGGGLVDMRYVKPPVTSGAVRSGKVYVNWEDSEQGGDYDQDMWGVIEWSLNTAANTITITTTAVSASTANPQGFGYSISGTTQDGPHFHSGIYNFNYTDPFGVLGCTNCNLPGGGGQTGATSITYTLGGAGTANTLKDPLWYAAKYGGFRDGNGNGRPDVATEWDRSNNRTGVETADGVPDNYFLVTNPLQLVSALGRALNDIGRDSSGTAVMANSTSLSTTDRIYQARYDPTDWRGQLLAKAVVADPVTGRPTISTTALWDAGLLLNARTPTDRVMLTFDDTATVRDGIAFRTANISANLTTQLATSPVTLVADAFGPQRLDYLRGDKTLEARNGGIFRSRSISILGDIVNSDPTFVGAPRANRPETSYGVFRDANFSRAAMIYVGANDGMLHGFDAVTGAEKLAYIPSKTFPHLAKLTSTQYAHRYYVDGPPEVSDAVVNGAWKTVLVGGLGGGGQGLYALDVTNPTNFSEGNAASTVLWEFNDTDNADLGYVYGKPVIRQMANNRWAAIVSGGYNNSEGDSATGSGRGVLFVIFLDGPTGANRTWVEGTDYIKIDTGVGDATTPNGLSPPFVADVDGDLRSDYVYAGDLRGNLWKFDLRSTATSDWTGATKRVILFTALDSLGNAQPITSQVEGTYHPTGTGFILVFGTGKYLEVADTSPVFRAQSFYGIWDKNNGGTSISGQTVVANRSSLLGQAITDVTGARTLPNVSPDWISQMGWYMDFPNSATTGERAVFRPILTASRLIFTTLIPSTEPCAGGGSGYLMIVDPNTGGRVAGDGVFDRNNDGLLNAADQVGGIAISGIQSPVGIAPTPVIVTGSVAGSATTNENKIYGARAPYLAGAGGALGFSILGGPLGVTGIAIGLGASAGRVSWREIITQ